MFVISIFLTNQFQQNSELPSLANIGDCWLHLVPSSSQISDYEDGLIVHCNVGISRCGYLVISSDQTGCHMLILLPDHHHHLCSQLMVPMVLIFTT